MPDFRERSIFNNVAMEARGLGGASYACQIMFELLDNNPNVGYRFHVIADGTAKEYIDDYVLHFGISDLVAVIAGVDNFSEWLNPKDIYIFLPSNIYNAVEVLLPLSMGLKVYIPYSNSDIYREIEDIYKYQTTTDLISTIIEAKGSSIQSAQVASRLYDELSL